MKILFEGYDKDPYFLGHFPVKVSIEESYMSSIIPNDKALRALASNPDEDIIVMLNLLKFKGEAGARAYDRYMKSVTKILEARGAHVVYAGKAAELLVGNETWDAIILVEYPSRKVFLEMVSSPEYKKAHVDREQGLERTVLYATSPLGETERFSE